MSNLALIIDKDPKWEAATSTIEINSPIGHKLFILYTKCRKRMHIIVEGFVIK